MARNRGDEPPLYLRGRTYWTWCYDPEGNRVRHSTHQRSRNAALAAAREIRRSVASGQANRAPVLTLREALRQLLAADVRGQGSQVTQEIHAHKGRHLTRLLGTDYNVHTVKRPHLERYTDRRLEERVTPHTVFKELGVLRQAVRNAGIEWKRETMPDLGDVHTPRERWLSPDEYELLLRALNPNHRDYVMMWCHTGLRESELYKVREEDVDLANRRLWVRGSKTDGALRWVPLSDEAVAVLSRRRRFPRWGNSCRDLAAACKRAGVAKVSPNGLRRTCGSWMACNGVPLYHAAEVMGHKSIRMLEKVYARLAPQVLHSAVSGFKAVTQGVTESVPGMDPLDKEAGVQA